jgi:hypothetical protein
MPRVRTSRVSWWWRTTNLHLRDRIAEQVAATCRAQGAEVDVRPCNADQSVWSVDIRRAIPPTGPSKVGDPDFVLGAGLKK